MRLAQDQQCKKMSQRKAAVEQRAERCSRVQGLVVLEKREEKRSQVKICLLNEKKKVKNKLKSADLELEENDNMAKK